MSHRILIVGDNKTQTNTLLRILNAEYDVTVTNSSEKALEAINENKEKISVILIDLILPVVDAYRFLRSVSDNELLTQIPIIAITSLRDEKAQQKALSMGASCFITKPFNKTIILNTIKSSMRLINNENTSDVTRSDNLTGLLNREGFFELAGKMISEKEEKHYILSCINIDNFKGINDRYGYEIGDEILKYIGKNINSTLKVLKAVACRFTADKFVLLYPAEFQNSESLMKMHKKVTVPTCINERVYLRIGRFLVDDKSMNVNTMCDRADMAQSSIKGRYDVYIADYQESMREDYLNKQRIISEMDDALRLGQFEAYYQPIFNHSSGALIGAEALARWAHPQRGLIMPGEFIPVFEENGFVYELDKYIWEQVCIELNKKIKQGEKPLPVSVNVSRYDIFATGFSRDIKGLVEKYNILIDLLRLEITESAFAKDTWQITKIARSLIDYGFIIEIDDFGSGYSSLNVLKDVPAQILKIDIRFLEDNDGSQRGGNILQSVVRMAQWLGMSVIAEGVESKLQADYLKSIGCVYIQGYFYSKPITLEEYDRLVINSKTQTDINRIENVETFENNAIWDPSGMDSLIFNNYIGAACIFEYHNNHTQLLRVNEKYRKVFGDVEIDGKLICDVKPKDYLDEENLRIQLDNIKNAIKTRSESTCEIYCCINKDSKKTHLYIRSTVRVIARAGDRYLFYCLVQNITKLKLSEMKQRKLEEEKLAAGKQLSVIMNNIAGGVCAAADENGSPCVLFANRQFYELFGYTQKEMHELKLDPFDLVYEKDKESILINRNKAKEKSESFMVLYRIHTKEGILKWMRGKISFVKLPDIEGIVELSVTMDVTEQLSSQNRRLKAEVEKNKLSDIIQNVNAGICAVSFKGTNEELAFANGPFYEMFGYTPDEARELNLSMYDLIVTWEREETLKFIRENVLNNNKNVITGFRCVKKDGTLIFVRCCASNVDKDKNSNMIIAVLIDVSEEAEENDQIRFLNEAAGNLLNSSNAKTGINDTLKSLLKYFDADRAYVFEVSEDNTVANNTYEVCAGGISAQKDNLQNVPMSLMEFWKNSFKNKSSLYIADVDALGEERSEERELLKAQSINSLMAAPILRNGEFIGFIGVDNLRNKIGRVDHLASLGEYIGFLIVRRDLDEQIKKDASSLKAVMDGIPGGYGRFKITDDNKVTALYFSEGFQKLVQQTNKELLDMYGKDVLKGVHFKDRPLLRNVLSEILLNREAHNVRVRLKTHKGGFVWVSVYARIQRTKSMESAESFLNVYVAKASEQKSAEETQIELLDNIPCGAALYKIETGKIEVTHLNRYYWTLVNRQPPKYCDIKVYDPIYPPDRQIVELEIASAIKSKRDVHCDVRILYGEKKEYRAFHVNGKMVNLGGDKYSMYAAYTPISEDAMSVQALMPIALSAMLSSFTDYAFIKDSNLRYIACSASAARLLGLNSASDIIGKTDYDLFDKALADEYIASDKKLPKSGKAVIDVEEKLPTHSGAVGYCVYSKHPLLDSEGNIVGIFRIARDSTKLHEANFELDTLLNVIPSGVLKYSADEKQKFAYISRSFVESLGYTHQSFKKKFANRFDKMIYKKDRDSILKQISDQECDGRIGRFDFRIEDAKGDLRWFHDEGIKITDMSGKEWYYVILIDITDRKNTEDKLRKSEEEYRLAIENTGISVCRYDILKKDLVLSDNIVEKYGMEKVLKNVPDLPVENKLISDDTKKAYIEFYDKIRRGEKTASTEYQRILNGKSEWLEAHASSIFSNDGQALAAIITFNRITDRIEKEAIYRKWKQSLTNREASSYSLFCCNIIKDVSVEFTEGSLIKKEFDTLQATSFDKITREFSERYVFKEDRKQFCSLLRGETMLSDYYKGIRTFNFDFRKLTDENYVFWLSCSVELVENPNSQDIMAYLMFEDIDEDKKEEIKIRRRSETDALSGLYNRTTFAKKLNDTVSNNPEYINALFILDIDNFKGFNDKYGHEQGDNVLTTVSSVITSITRNKDIAGRLGGDEFFVFLSDIPNEEVAAKKASQLQSILKKENINGEGIYISIGIALYPNDGDMFEKLYHSADCALYYTKEHGKDGFAFYNEDMEE